MKLKKTISGVLAASMLMLGSFSTLGNVSAYSVETKDTPAVSGAAAAEKSGSIADESTTQEYDYGLNSTIEGGAILHAWEWSFKTIEANMPLIAQSGYTAVQTSPASLCYSVYPTMTIMGKLDDEGDGTYDGHDGAWWWTYQPTALTIGNYQLGTRENYVAMCKEAKKYGVKIITDVVLNHTTAMKNDDQYAIEPNSYVNSTTGVPNYDNLYRDTLGKTKNNNYRFSMINYDQGLPDINTENPYYQRYMLTYLNDLINAGCDGFRFDTAHHIGIPIDPKKDLITNTTYDLNYNFWPVATGQETINVDGENWSLQKNKANDGFFFYGEILGNTLKKSDVSSETTNGAMFREYVKYVDVTDSAYSDVLRAQIKNSNLSASSIAGSNDGSYWGDNPLQTSNHDQLITWVESHDSYCNTHYSGSLSDWQIRACWAVIAARSGGTPLFFNRPDGSSGADNKYWGKNVIGKRGNDEFFHPEVVAVNKFRNAMSKNNAKKENVVNVNSNNKVLQIDRYPESNKTTANCGTCIINISDSDVTINNQSTNIADGTYYDTITGQEYIVSGGKLSGGTVARRSIATIYNTANILVTPGSKTFTSNGLNVTATINGSSVTTGNYKVMCGGEQVQSGTFTSGTPFTIGKTVSVTGSSKELTLIVSAVDNGVTFSNQYIYDKRDISDVTYVYCDKNRNSGNVYAYIYYEEASGKSDCIYKNAEWPGVKMTLDSNDNNYISCEVPKDVKNGKVIFNNGSSNIAGSNEFSLNNESWILPSSGNTVSVSNITLTADEDEELSVEQDENLTDYRYLYFNNTQNWTNVTAVINGNSYNMTFSDDMQLYYCRFPTDDINNSVTFTNGTDIIDAGTIYAGQVYDTASSTWKLPNAISYTQTVENCNKSTDVDVVINYNETDVANSKSSNSYTQTSKSFSTEVTVTNGNISQAIADATSQMGMTSVYDDYTFYGSNVAYVRGIASLTDDRLPGILPCSAYVNPNCFANQSDTFSGIYGNSDSFITKLNSANESWIKYYNKVNNNYVEIDFDDIDSTMSNLSKIEVYAFSKPKTYTVKFHYPKNSGDTLSSFKNNTLFTNTSNTELYHCRYNELLEDATTNIQNNMVIPTGKTFDGWYMLTIDNGISSYLKVSSEQNFRYRITDQNLDLYAVFRTNSTVPKANATALASSVDKFQDSTGVKYRYNTILNINDYKSTDGTVTDVAVVYVYGGSVSASSAKEQITNSIINSKETGTTTAISGTNYKLYKYTTGSSGTVELTNKNRLQFVLTLKDTQVGDSGTYSNVLAFVAYKCYNGTWKVSDNCVTYLNGAAAPTMIINN